MTPLPPEETVIFSWSPLFLPHSFEGVDMKIDIPDLPGNSNLAKSKAVQSERSEVHEKQPAVAQGRLKPAKKRTRLSEVFTAEDTGSVASFVFTRLVIPRLQVLAVDTINAVARAIFLGERTSEPSRKKPGGYTSYQGYYEGNKAKPKLSSSKKTSGSYQFQEVIVDSYGDAQLILDKLDEILESQGYVTVSDLYEAADLPCPFTGNYYGWDNISAARITTDSDGYLIEMPQATALKD